MTGRCPRCKVERDLTVLPGGLLRCSWCTLVLRARTSPSIVQRRRDAVESRT